MDRRRGGKKKKFFESCTFSYNFWGLDARDERRCGVKKERRWREEVLRRMERLADQRPNDAVKLAFLTEAQAACIDQLDLRALTELKRHGNGAVEIKLVDKMAALERLYEMAKESGEGADAFLKALEQSVEQGGGGRPCEVGAPPQCRRGGPIC